MKLKLSKDSKFRFAVRSALFAGLAASAGGAAYAQEAMPQPSPDQAPAKEKPKSALEVAQATPAPAATPAAPEAAAELGIVQVTGSRIPQPKLSVSNSVVEVDAQNIKLTGYVNIETLINNLPQALPELSTGDSNGSLGIATVDLRGLGSQRTLVLIDGKRLNSGDPNATIGANLNFIPVELIDGVDILSGGTSAVYGSDALAGAVNFKMKRDFEGFKFDGTDRFSTTHGDAHQYATSFVYGTNFAGGSGNATVYAGFTKLEALREAARGFSAFSLNGRDTNKDGVRDTFRRAGSFAIPEGYVLSYDRLYATDELGNSRNLNYTYIVDPLPASDPRSSYLNSGAPGGGTRTFIPGDGRRFNFAPDNFFQRPDRRYHLGGFAHREFNKNLDLFADVMFLDSRQRAQIAPDATFFQRYLINCDNPLMSDQERQLLCGDVGLNSTPNEFHPGGVDNATVLFPKRFTEKKFFGPRIADLRHTDYRIVIGAKGNIPFADWATYDLSAQRGEDVFSGVNINGASFARIQQAFQVTTDANGNPVCKPDLGGINNAGCVPFDLFQVGKVDQAQADFIRNDSLTAGGVVEQVVNGNVTADLTTLGIKTPFTPYGPAVNLGYEYRTETLDVTPDATLQAGDDPGNGGPRPKVSGGFQVHGVFGEVKIPLVDDQFLVKRLALNGAWRDDEVSTKKSAHSYNLGVNYAPIADVGFRANLARAVRVASIQELFSPQFVNLFNGNDPCSGPVTDGRTAAGFTLEECARTGVTPAQFGRIPDCPASQCNALIGGNPALTPERSITRELGIVLTPTFLKGFSATFDAWNISLNNPIGVIPPTQILQQCLTTGDPSFCDLIQRGPGSGTLFGPNTNFVSATNINVGAFRLRGYDVGLDYRLQFSDLPLGVADYLGDWGGLAFAFNGTLLNSFRTDTGAAPNGTAAFECAGLFGPTCGRPLPKWKHVLRTTWRSPFGLDLSANWRHLGATNADVNSDDPNLSGTKVTDNIGGKIKLRNYLDLTARYAPPFAMLQGLGVQVGVTNVLNRRPPVVTSGSPSLSGPVFGNGNTFPNQFEVQGPVFFAGLTYDIK